MNLEVHLCFNHFYYYLLLFIIYYLLFIIYYLLFIIYYLLFIIYYLLFFLSFLSFISFLSFFKQYIALLKEIWSNKYTVVAPSKLKKVLGRFARRFSGWQQQDSSELLSFLLDGLHEDLNLVKNKPPTPSI